jgi:hypothetical protein
MKKIFLILLSLALVFSLGFTACEDFKDPPPEEEVIETPGGGLGAVTLDLSELTLANTRHNMNASAVADFGKGPFGVYASADSFTAVFIVDEWATNQTRNTLYIPIPDDLLDELKAKLKCEILIDGDVSLDGTASTSFRWGLGKMVGSNWNNMGLVTSGFPASATEYTISVNDPSEMTHLIIQLTAKPTSIAMVVIREITIEAID